MAAIARTGDTDSLTDTVEAGRRCVNAPNSGFAPAVPVALRLDPDPERRTWYGGWRRKIELPACRLVWVGDASPHRGNGRGGTSRFWSRR